MMAKYYFHIRVGNSVIPDDEGFDLADLEAVQEEAIRSVDDLRREAALNQYLAENLFSIEVRDEAGNQVLIQPITYVNGRSAY
jgi:hypothetical protein